MNSSFEVRRSISSASSNMGLNSISDLVPYINLVKNFALSMIVDIIRFLVLLD